MALSHYIAGGFGVDVSVVALFLHLLDLPHYVLTHSANHGHRCTRIAFICLRRQGGVLCL